MKITVYHATGTYRFLPWRPESVLRRVDEFTTDQVQPYGGEADWMTNPLAVAEQVFRLHNVVNGDERNMGLRVRSLSVGDVVCIDGTAYAVNPIGFRQIDADQLQIEG